MIKVGVIGYGYWGPNLVRNFSELGDSTVSMVCDLLPDRLAKARAYYPAIRTTSNDQELIEDPNVDAVAIATTVSTHFDLALRALRAGKHVLVEKPLTSSSEQAAQLIEEAKRLKRVLMVDHTFVYTGAVAKIRDLVMRGELGEVLYYDSARINLGLFQHDVNVIWDLAVHDLSIMDYVLPFAPIAVSATGMSHVGGQPENVAYLTLFFEGSVIGHVHVNWLAPVKLRRTLIGGSQKMVVYDDLEPSEKIKVYDKGITVHQSAESVYQMLISYRTGDMWAPQLDGAEALQKEARHFISCIEKDEQPLTDGGSGLRIVQILEAATQSMAKRGEVIELNLQEKMEKIK
jgi:predicted dehydrogenase